MFREILFSPLTNKHNTRRQEDVIHPSFQQKVDIGVW